MNNMYWLHCNGCYCQPEDGVVLRFYITNCSHIFCEKCVSVCTKERCKICQSQCATLELSGKLQKEVENLFDEPANLFQKTLKQVDRTLEFQKSHQRRWCRHLKEMLRQQGQQFKELKKLVVHQRNLEKEIMELKKENSYLKCLLAKSDPGIRAGTRGGSFQGASPNQSMFRRSPQHTMQMHPLSSSRNNGPLSSALKGPDRILLRTPPTDGKLGSIRSHHSYMTPESLDARKSVYTPLAAQCTPDKSMPKRSEIKIDLSDLKEEEEEGPMKRINLDLVELFPSVAARKRHNVIHTMEQEMEVEEEKEEKEDEQDTDKDLNSADAPIFKNIFDIMMSNPFVEDI